MATYYTSPSGNDADNGLGPDASDATNRPWLTFDHALSTAVAGDTVYFGPGMYRDGANVADNSGAAGNLISFIGDPHNVQGFRDGAGVLLTQGYVRLSVWAVDDATSVNTILLQINSKSYLWFENLIMEGGGSYGVVIFGVPSQYITFKRCCIVNGSVDRPGFQISVAADTSAELLLDECQIYSPAGTCFNIVTEASAIAEYDCGITIKNCVMFSAQLPCIWMQPTAGAFEGTGGDVIGCFLFGYFTIQVGAGWTAASAFPMYVRNCFLMGVIGPYQPGAGLTDSIDEDYNIIWALVPRSGIAAGANTIVGGPTSGVDTKFFRFNLLEPWMYGFAPQPPFSPMEIGLQLGAGTNLGHLTDAIGRLRPSGSGTALPTIGALERHEYGTKETVVVDAGDASLKLTGPGDHEINIAVDAEATTLSVKVRYESASYTLGTRPSVTLFDVEGFAGIAGNSQTLTATAAAADAWETLTFTAFTPTRKGAIKIRMVNASTAGAGVCYFDTLSKA